MKKLVLLSAFLSPYRSGAEAMVEEVSARLSGRYDITIVTGRYSRTLPKRERIGRVQVIRVGLGMPFDKWLYPFLAPPLLGRLRPDIVHAVLETFAGLTLFFCRCKAKKILTLQTTNRTFLKKTIVNYPDSVTAISADLKRIAEGLGRTDVVVIPNGIDLTGITAACKSFAKDSGRILFVGRLEPMKGVDTLLKAFAIAAKGQPPHVHLRIVGDGSQRASLKSLAKELEIDHRVTFTGRVDGTKLFEEYARAEIFCGLSRSEALGNVFLESQAAGCPVVATDVGGIPEIVKHETTGILVPPDDPEAAAAALKKLLSDTYYRARLSVEARKNAERYGWDGIAERYATVLG
jgi:glycosyltransferase involved in cell wall biosynthesis